MEQFDLEKWLQDKSRKVVTRQSKPVRIICTDRKHSESWPIVALESYDSGEFVLYANDKGRTDLVNENIHDLFFADEEEELTDFESDLFTAFSDAWQQYLRGESVDVAEWAKEHSKDLLESARKEIYEDMKSLSKEE